MRGLKLICFLTKVTGWQGSFINFNILEDSLNQSSVYSTIVMIQKKLFLIIISLYCINTQKKKTSNNHDNDSLTLDTANTLAN